ncbi:MAG: phosphoethanolamine transferase [Thiothrix sp.]|nr:MAG: phosphoethanolamine transferase [Thiothrix sp.]
MRSTQLTLLVSVFLVLLYNFAFFNNFIGVYPLSSINLVHLLSLAVLLVSILLILLNFVLIKFTTKPILIVLVMVSSVAAYFMDTYNVIIDTDMIRNILLTDAAESRDLLNYRLLIYVLILGIFPAIYIYKLNIYYGSVAQELVAKIKVIALGLLLMIATTTPLGGFYASFFREHKILRYYTNPLTYIYSYGKYLTEKFSDPSESVTPLGINARRSATDVERELVILVVGETARSDRFSLNGYKRRTNPLLEKEEVYSFSNVSSCGTSTAISVPCMFSKYNRHQFSNKKAKHTENLLDVLNHAGVHVLWRDNNSSSKGVADRVTYENFKSKENNPVCDTECRDEGMLAGLQDYIGQQTNGDILIVLHQMGNHGPGYYKRYPKSFEKYRPVCKTNQLDECSKEEINNAYDNAILYTDYFLSKVIGLLKKNSNEFETVMIYMSDHGESLGEKGLYLHGLPYFAAPRAQTHVPAVFWFGDNNDDMDHDALIKRRNTPYSHDNLFHTVIGIMELETSVYDREMDILQERE